MFISVLTQSNNFILGPIAKLLGYILNFLFEFLSNFGIMNAGICIILFTFIVKALMIPLTIKQQKFQKLSSKMNPELTKIQNKYKGKKDEASMRNQQIELQVVYQKYGVSPTSGCLPMLITFPIIFALYKVIYNIPAYVDGIKVFYENIAIAVQESSSHAQSITELAQNVGISTKSWNDFGNTIPINNIIDVLAKFKTTDWDLLKEAFPSITQIITTNSMEIMKINSFIGGLNIANAPGFAFPGILLPIVSVLSQIFMTKQMESVNKVDPDSPGAGAMKSMNTVMPIMSGIFCLVLPIGVGLYWVAGNVFQIIQQFFVNKLMNKMDVEEMIEHNLAKNNRKKERMGIDPKKIEEISKVSTKSISDKAKSVNSSNIGSNSTEYKPGSIASKANILKNKNADSKGDKR